MKRPMKIACICVLLYFVAVIALISYLSYRWHVGQ